MPVAPWLQWPPITLSGLSPGLANIVPIAAGHVNTEAFTDDCVAYGIVAHVISPVDGEAILKLAQPVSRDNFVGEATLGLPPELGGGFLPVVEWIDSTTIRIRTYKTIGAFDKAPRVDFNFWNVNTSQVPLVPDPLAILGGNLAVWLQSDDFANVSTPGAAANWTNRAPSGGTATTFSTSTAMDVIANSFGGKPGVACVAAPQALRLTLPTPIPINSKPYVWAKFRLTSIDNVVNSENLCIALYHAGNLNLGALQFEGDGPLSFPPTAFWFAGGTTNPPAGATAQLTPPDLDLNPHTVQLALDLPLCVFDGVAMTDVSGTPAPCTGVMDTLQLNGLGIAPTLFGGTVGPGFANWGVVVVSFDQPTPLQAAAMLAYLNAYV